MANNQNFSNLLLENIGNEILIAFEVITSSKDLTETTGRPALSESSINHSPINDWLSIVGKNRKAPFSDTIYPNKDLSRN